jgi:deazaflavin-dependent oxidoreductase (nitroreductase family)
MPSSFNQQVIEKFRANGGKVGPPFKDGYLVLLGTRGARTGTVHTTPLASLREDGRLFVFATYAGSDRDPQWYRNLVADPAVTVETGAETYTATAAPLPEPERTRVFAAAVAGPHPGFADYEAKAGRVIPVVELTRA